MRESQGSILIIILVLLVIMSLMSLSMLNVGWLEEKSLQNQHREIKNKQAASSLLQTYEQQLKKALRGTDINKLAGFPELTILEAFDKKGIKIVGLKVTLVNSNKNTNLVAFYHYYPESNDLLLISKQ